MTSERMMVRIPDALRGPLEDYIRAEEHTFFRNGARTDEEEILRRAENAVFLAVMQTQVCNDPKIPARQYNNMLSSIMVRSVSRGRPRRYREDYYDAAFRRQVRDHFVAKLLARALGAEYKDLPATSPNPRIESDDYYPSETLEMLLRLEFLLRIRLPPRCYVLFTRDDREYLAEHDVLPDAKIVEEVGCQVVRYEDYVEARKDPAVRVEIHAALKQKILSSGNLQGSTTDR